MSAKKVLFFPEVPKFPWLYALLFWWSDQVVVGDTGLLDFSDRGPAIRHFLQWLEGRGWRHKAKVIEPLDHDDKRVEANLASIELVKQYTRSMRRDRSESFFVGGYLSHQLQVRVATALYSRSLIREIEENGAKVICLNGCRLPIRPVGFIGALEGLLLPLVLMPFWAVLIVAQLRRRVRFAFRARPRSEGGFCMDLLHGPALEKESGSPVAGRYADTCMVEPRGEFSLENHLFLDFGWRSPQFREWKCELESRGAKIIGSESSPVLLTPAELLGLLGSNIRRWLAHWMGGSSPEGGWGRWARWLQFRYHLDLFRAQLAFVHARPSVYFSRMDYSYRHHVLGAECERKGILFAGVSHSPSGGEGHVPQFSIISFATYFTYKPIFWENFYPSWQESGARLCEVGVWRSDFIHQSRGDPKLSAKRVQLQAKMGDRFVVALHLPVPQSPLYDRATTEKWMGWFLRLIHECPDLGFVLFPRRLHQAPDYFKQLVESMLEPGRCELADKLYPEWTQAYRWVPMCDMVVGCSFSDAVIEALASGCPAISYADVGEGSNELERFEHSLSVYNGDTLIDAVISTKDGVWPSDALWRDLREGLVGVADGHCMDRIKAELRPSLQAEETS